MAKLPPGLKITFGHEDVTDKVDLNAAYPTKPKPIGPSDKVRIQLPPGCVMFGDDQIDAYITGVTHNMSHADVASVTVDWVAVEDPGVRGTAHTYHLAGLVEGVVLTADSIEKNYEVPSSIDDFESAYFPGNGWAHKPKPKSQADLSQIAADLAKLPKAPPWGQSPLKTLAASIDPGALFSPSTAHELLQNYLKPNPFLKPAADKVVDGLSADVLTVDDLKAAFDSIDGALANNEKQNQAAAEQIAKFGEVYLDAADGSVIPIGSGEIKFSHDLTPIGKLHEYKQTDVGLEATFTTELKDVEFGGWVEFDPAVKPKKIKHQKLQEANAKVVLEKAGTKFLSELWIGLTKLPPQLEKGEMMGINQILALPDGSKLEAHITIQKKEEKP